MATYIVFSAGGRMYVGGIEPATKATNAAAAWQVAPNAIRLDEAQQSRARHVLRAKGGIAAPGTLGAGRREACVTDETGILDYAAVPCSPDEAARIIAAESPVAVKARVQPMVLCDCGHEAEWPLSASLGSACADCYDRMSD